MKIIKFKSVNKDLSSKYDPNFKYKVGKTFEIEADTSNKECSTGLHCSGIIYANGYEWNKDQKIIEVEVEEKDKAKFLIENNILSRILIASKTDSIIKIKFEDFK